uniref:E2 ubiquitin-conjugating enzyme n=1 Tax=Noccaea caerulescens TaxID=107243 RepID=A0A1J3HK00_NOCCA
MEPDVVEIAPPLVPFAPRTRKPRKAGVPEVIDVEQYEFRNGVVSNNNNNNNNNNLADKKNKGKAKQDYYDHNPLSHFDNDDMMEIDGFSTFQAVHNSKTQSAAKSSRSSSRNQSTEANWNPFLANPYAPPQSWDFYSGLAVPHQNNQTVYSSSATYHHPPQTPDVVMMPGPPSRAFTFDGSASSSRRSRRIAAEVVCSPHEVFLKNFKRFDTVEDFSDHHYASMGKASKQHSKPWVKKVQADWKILENDLPETIFVRACESRMDLLRAVIIGPEGTPYHDGLFFFDIQFPDTYPSVPPKVYYHSGGLRINPNLYNCGKVCLSLLGTWSGNAREKWLPKESTMLQLLVSIQALILNQKPYFNEPGYASSAGTVLGEAHSKLYSENVFLLSLNTMVYSMRRPPKHFEEFVRSHYSVRAHDIVKACNAYQDGAPLGSMVKGGVQDVEEASQSGSQKFRTDVTKFMKPVVEEFVKLGVKELELKPPPQSNANTASDDANRKRGRATR